MALSNILVKRVLLWVASVLFGTVIFMQAFTIFGYNSVRSHLSTLVTAIILMAITIVMIFNLRIQVLPNSWRAHFAQKMKPFLYLTILGVLLGFTVTQYMRYRDRNPKQSGGGGEGGDIDTIPIVPPMLAEVLWSTTRGSGVFCYQSIIWLAENAVRLCIRSLQEASKLVILYSVGVVAFIAMSVVLYRQTEANKVRHDLALRAIDDAAAAAAAVAAAGAPIAADAAAAAAAPPAGYQYQWDHLRSLATFVHKGDNRAFITAASQTIVPALKLTKSILVCVVSVWLLLRALQVGYCRGSSLASSVARNSEFETFFCVDLSGNFGSRHQQVHFSSVSWAELLEDLWGMVWKPSVVSMGVQMLPVLVYLVLFLVQHRSVVYILGIVLAISFAYSSDTWLRRGSGSGQEQDSDALFSHGAAAGGAGGGSAVATLGEKLWWQRNRKRLGVGHQLGYLFHFVWGGVTVAADLLVNHSSACCGLVACLVTLARNSSPFVRNAVIPSHVDIPNGARGVVLGSDDYGGLHINWHVLWRRMLEVGAGPGVGAGAAAGAGAGAAAGYVPRFIRGTILSALSWSLLLTSASTISFGLVHGIQAYRCESGGYGVYDWITFKDFNWQHALQSLYPQQLPPPPHFSEQQQQQQQHPDLMPNWDSDVDGLPTFLHEGDRDDSGGPCDAYVKADPAAAVSREAPECLTEWPPNLQRWTDVNWTNHFVALFEKAGINTSVFATARKDFDWSTFKYSEVNWTSFVSAALKTSVLNGTDWKNVNWRKFATSALTSIVSKSGLKTSPKGSSTYCSSPRYTSLNATFDVDYTNAAGVSTGRHTTNVRLRFVRPIGTGAPSDDIQIGDPVEVNYRGQGTWIPATVIGTRINEHSLQARMDLVLCQGICKDAYMPLRLHVFRVVYQSFLLSMFVQLACIVSFVLMRELLLHPCLFSRHLPAALCGQMRRYAGEVSFSWAFPIPVAPGSAVVPAALPTSVARSEPLWSEALRVHRAIYTKLLSDVVACSTGPPLVPYLSLRRNNAVDAFHSQLLRGLAMQNFCTVMTAPEASRDLHLERISLYSNHWSSTVAAVLCFIDAVAIQLQLDAAHTYEVLKFRVGAAPNDYALGDPAGLGLGLVPADSVAKFSKEIFEISDRSAKMARGSVSGTLANLVLKSPLLNAKFITDAARVAAGIHPQLDVLPPFTIQTAIHAVRGISAGLLASLKDDVTGLAHCHVIAATESLLRLEICLEVHIECHDRCQVTAGMYIYDPLGKPTTDTRDPATNMVVDMASLKAHTTESCTALIRGFSDVLGKSDCPLRQSDLCARRLIRRL